MVTVPAELPPLVDRQEEVARIAEALDAAERGEGQLLLLRGEAGCGKTRLAQEAAAQAARRGFVTGFGTALSESVALFHPWKEALEGLHLGRILEEPPPPKILGLYAVTAGGEIAAKEEREDAALAPSVVSAISTIARGHATSHGDLIEEGAFTFFPLDGVRGVDLRADGFHVSAILEGREDEALLADLRDLAREVEPSVDALGRRDGGSDARTSIRTALRGLLDTGKYEGIDNVRGDPKLRQARLFDQVVSGLLRKAETSPQLVAIDDLQWADPSTLALLHSVARSLQRSRVLLMGAYRVEEAGARPHLRDALAKMEQDRQPAGLLVGGLPRDEMRRLVEVFLGPHALPGDFLDTLWRETQGYPLFIREVLRGLEDDGAIRLRGAAKRLEQAVDQLAIPVRVREAIRLRLEKLPKDERRLLDAAAACGTRFTSALLAKVAGEEEGEVLRGLENLSRVHGLLRAMGSGFSFDHPAIQEVAYEASPPAARRAHHLEAAAWLDLVGGPVEDVADHLYRAGEPRAVPKLREAAEGARARYANAEAIRFYDEALSLEEDAGRRWSFLIALGSLHRSVGDYGTCLATYSQALDLAKTDRERARTAASIADVRLKMGDYETALKDCVRSLPLVDGEGVEEEAALLGSIGEAHWRQGDYEQALECYGRSLAIREKIGNQEDIAKSLNNIGAVHNVRGNHERAIEYLRRSLAICEKLGNQEGLAALLNNIGVVYNRQGDHERALEYSDKALAICRKIGDQAGIAQALNSIGVVHERRGDYEHALECLGRSLAIREKIGNQEGVAQVLDNIGVVHWERGDYERSLEYYGRSLAIREKIGNQRGIAWSLTYVGDVYASQRDYERALEYLSRSLAICEKIGDQAGIALASTDLAETTIRKGDLFNAEIRCGQALRVAAQIGNKGATSFARRVRGMLHGKQGRWDESAADFEESLRILAHLGFPFDEGRTRYEFGLMWKNKGEGERAKEHLSRAVQIFERIGAAKELEKAQVVLRDLP